ncbi:reverse transcriptase domain-containing protein [Tanacetum coccineum]|uniref:Reverse transcriptase domain-containing protein n=1 Tax=Tanacetum coccineum TaxID=301880 RepID=A0ABQ5BCT1_9ASTR
MRTRSSARRLLSPIEDPERLLSRRNRSEPSLLFDLEEDDMAEQVSPQGPIPDLRSIEELLQAPADGVGDAIVVPLILANQFELKIAQTWLEKEPPNSITTWNDLVSKFVNRFFPPSKTTNLRNEITRFQQIFGETFFEAWDRFKYLLNKCPHHGFSPLHQIDTFYNSLNQSDQDSLNSAVNGNFLTKNTQEALTIIENKFKNFIMTSDSRIQTLTNEMVEIKKVLFQRPQAGPFVPPPPLSSYSSKEVEQDPKTITYQIPPSPASTSSELPKRNPHQPPIPYPSRLNKEKLQDNLAEALALMPKYHKMLKDLLFDKDKLLGLANTSLNKNCSAVLLKKLLEKLGDPGKFLIPSGIAEDVFVQVGKFTFPADFVVIDYDVDPRVPLILGRPYLRTARALVDVYGEELILRDGDEKLIFHADSTSKHPQKHGNESINMINFIDITCEDRFLEVLKIKKPNHPISGSTTFASDSSSSLTHFETSDSLLEEFTDELALLDPFPLGNVDDNFDPEADLREIESLLNRDPSTDSSPTTVIDIIDPIFERFIDEPALVYSASPGDDDDEDDDLFDLKSDNDEWRKLLYGDNFNDIHSEKDKIKDSKMKILIDELESPKSNVLLPQLLDSDSTLPEKSSESSEIATLLSSSFENEDKVFNPGTLILGGTQIFNDESQDKNLNEKTSSEALLILEECNFLSISSNQELLFPLELSVTETLLSFSSENEDKVFNPGIFISKGVYSFTLGLSHPTYETFKIINVHPNILNGDLPMIVKTTVLVSILQSLGLRSSSFNVDKLKLVEPLMLDDELGESLPSVNDLVKEQDAMLAEDTIVERKTSSARRGERKSYRIRRKGQRPSEPKWFSKEVGEA